MDREARSALLPLVAALIVVILGACSAGVSVGDVQTVGPPELPEHAPSGEAWIDAVSLGTSDQESFDPARVGTELPEGTPRVAVWYRWSGAETGKRIDIRWSLGGETILEQGESIAEADGTAAWFLKTEDGGPLPNGSYQVELLEDGEVVAAIPFTVGE